MSSGMRNRRAGERSEPKHPRTRTLREGEQLESGLWVKRWFLSIGNLGASGPCLPGFGKKEG